MSGRDEYVIDTYGLPRDREVAVCEFALRLVSPEAGWFETDIVLSKLDDLPAAVASAARQLSTHSKGRRGESDGYRQTGVVSASNPQDWDAFVTYAAYAYDATVWSTTRHELASLSDEGTALVMHLLPPELSALVDFAGKSTVIPMKEWQKVRRRVLRERRSNRG